MPSFDPPKRLPGHEMLSVSAVRGHTATFFGILCLAVGVFILLAAMDRLPIETPEPNVPRWMMGLFALVFWLPGAVMLIIGLRDQARSRRIEHDRATQPNAPWLWDHAWDPTGTRDDGVRRALQGLTGVVGFGVFLVPFNALVIFEWDEIVPRIVIGFFDVLFLLSLGTVLYRAAAELRHGRVRLRYGGFPFRLGGHAQVTVSGRAPRGRLRELTCLLRCIEERFETVGTGRNRRTQPVAYEHYREERRLDPVTASAAITGGGLPLSFSVPEAPEMSSRLSRPPIIYWLLELQGETSGIDYDKRFLMPIYR